jgi:hypothetical protein
MKTSQSDGLTEMDSRSDFTPALPTGFSAEFQHLLGNGRISEFPRRPTLGNQNAQRAVDPRNLKFRSAGVSFAAGNNL